jgi:hypothetical protein
VARHLCLRNGIEGRHWRRPGEPAVTLRARQI